jgi:protocatechuate 3,4-dioxygenase beta subunit
MIAQIATQVIASLITVADPQPMWVDALDGLRTFSESAGQFIERTISSLSPDNSCPKEKQERAINDSSRIVLVDKNEPGEALDVSGTVYAPDGKTPVEGITVYVYHTDAKGYYNEGNRGWQNPRLKGTMITNSEGKYEFRTIKPAPYPGRKIPAHIHYALSAKGYPLQYDEVMFQGDQYITDRERSQSTGTGTFSDVRPLTRDKDGALHCIRDFRLKNKG